MYKANVFSSGVRSSAMAGEAATAASTMRSTSPSDAALRKVISASVGSACPSPVPSAKEPVSQY
jgi:hypothetical protein